MRTADGRLFRTEIFIQSLCRLLSNPRLCVISLVICMRFRHCCNHSMAFSVLISLQISITRTSSVAASSSLNYTVLFRVDTVSRRRIITNRLISLNFAQFFCFTVFVLYYEEIRHCAVRIAIMRENSSSTAICHFFKVVLLIIFDYETTSLQVDSIS